MTISPERRSIVIVGGGIIGCCTAYYLTRHPSYDPQKHSVTILEPSKIAGGASGKAGGLLALWAYPKAIVPLSFRLHAELAAAHEGRRRWGYRRLHVAQLTAHGQPPSTEAGGQGANRPNTSERISLEKRNGAGAPVVADVPEDLDWFYARGVRGYEAMGDPNDSGQVHPFQFTTAMAELACEAGAKIVRGRAIGSDLTGVDGVDGVKYVPSDGGELQQLPATDVVLAAGPWTSVVYPPAPIAALRAHSVTIQPSRPVSAYAVFTEITIPASGTRRAEHVTPEIYARPGNEVYACGEGDQLVPLPPSTAEVETDLSRCQAIVDQVGSISHELRNGTVTARQACYLPNVEGVALQGPLIGKTKVRGLFMATGHTCWGIQNGPGTGKLMSEFIFDGEAKSANVRSLDPQLVL